uniref:AlNc14C38G3323 protein n=1 Tax=Albugo laibachii Nc14 TaxID=890382 RepID=F0W956_9STRA|nr:AlNc14C38G3323 [Albugo laibachii Nc14]|eukprot:CCA17669.1 AlNc14C38G3323 [Albugo laibachii Nc14]
MALELKRVNLPSRLKWTFVPGTMQPLGKANPHMFSTSFDEVAGKLARDRFHLEITVGFSLQKVYLNLDTYFVFALYACRSATRSKRREEPSQQKFVDGRINPIWLVDTNSEKILRATKKLHELALGEYMFDPDECLRLAPKGIYSFEFMDDIYPKAYGSDISKDLEKIEHTSSAYFREEHLRSKIQFFGHSFHNQDVQIRFGYRSIKIPKKAYEVHIGQLRFEGYLINPTGQYEPIIKNKADGKAKLNPVTMTRQHYTSSLKIYVTLKTIMWSLSKKEKTILGCWAEYSYRRIPSLSTRRVK